MIDLIQAQKDIHGLLMSAPQLATVNIVEERKFIVEQELGVEAIWQTIRNNCQGCGLLIEVPEIQVDSNNVSGPPQIVTFSFVSFQNGDAAFLAADSTGSPQGGGLFAEQIEQFLVDILHLQVISGLGTLTVKGQFSGPAREYPLVNARRTKVIATPKQTAQTGRTAAVQIAVNAGLCTLTCASAGAAIYYTLDGSFPSNPTIAIAPLTNQPVNPDSTLYAAPFAVNPGQLIRAAAYLPGYNCGQITDYQAG